MFENKFPIMGRDRMRMGTDGSGVRTLIVLGGCPLRCKYCFNSSAWDGSMEPMYMTADEIVERFKIFELYMLATNGGLTFGGGEPLLHPLLIRELRNIVDKNLNFSVESSFAVPWENIEAVLNCVEEFVVDIKTCNTVLYYSYTGGRLELAMENLKKAIRVKGADKIVVRLPLIPGYNDMDSVDESENYLRKAGVERIARFEYQIT